jgi:hypothetical protein
MLQSLRQAFMNKGDSFDSFASTLISKLNHAAGRLDCRLEIPDLAGQAGNGPTTASKRMFDARMLYRLRFPGKGASSAIP